MPIEIEKKYRLTKQQRREIESRMRGMSLVPGELEHEENTIYRGGSLNQPGRALRLRRGNGRAYLTFQRRFPGKSLIKNQEGDEGTIADADGMDWSLRLLDFSPRLILEKRAT